MDTSKAAKAKRLKARQVALRNDANHYFAVCKDVRDWIAPRTARFDYDKDSRVDRGRREDQNIINITPRLCLRALTAGMSSGMTSQARPWFRFTTSDPDLMDYAPVTEFLFKFENLIRTVLLKSNFYHAIPKVYRSMGGYGTGAMSVLEDPDDIIRCTPFAIGSYLGAQNSRYVTDTFIRTYPATVKQLVDQFGNSVSRNVKTMYDRGDYDVMRMVMQSVMPNDDFNGNSILSRDKRFASVHIDMEEGDESCIMAERGFDQFPVMMPRWDHNDTEFWGNGPGEVALGACKAIQLEEKRKYQGIDLMNRPPTAADASLRNDGVNMLPGGQNFVPGMMGGNVGVRPVHQFIPPIGELREDIMKTEEMIKEAFYYNFFLQVTSLRDQPNITATQINTMRDEVLLQLSPVLEGVATELLDPTLNRVIDIVMKRGMVPEDQIPNEIKNGRVRIEYTSILAQAQKALNIGSIERFSGFVTALAGIKPNAIDKMDVDQAIDEYGTATGVSPKIVRSDDKVKAMREQDAQQQQMVTAAELAPKVSGAVSDLANSPVDADNALGRALGL